MDNKRKKKLLKTLYEVIMALLALAVAVMIIIEFAVAPSAVSLRLMSFIDTAIWAIFTVDYLIRFFSSKNKFMFFRSNIIDLIAIIPFNSIFQAARLFRVTRLFRLFKLVRLVSFAVLFYKKMDRFFKTNNFHFTLMITLGIVLTGAISICVVENMPFGNALWWSFVTASTVGYGDISPATPLGRIIAVILMIVGIGFLGMLTGTISTFFLNKKTEKSSCTHEILDNLKDQLDHFDELSEEDIDTICTVLKTLKQNSLQQSTLSSHQPK